jgi:tetratricopeptide (TPR) repeat protein
MRLFFAVLILSAFLLPPGHSLAQTPAEALKSIAEMRKDKQYLDALVLAERVIEKYPADIDLLKERAWLNQDRGERVLALQNFLDILAIYPDNDTVINSMGILYQYSGLLDSALACYSRCLSLAASGRDTFSANVNIGSVYLHM